MVGRGMDPVELVEAWLEVGDEFCVVGSVDSADGWATGHPDCLRGFASSDPIGWMGAIPFTGLIAGSAGREPEFQSAATDSAEPRCKTGSPFPETWSDIRSEPTDWLSVEVGVSSELGVSARPVAISDLAGGETADKFGSLNSVGGRLATRERSFGSTPLPPTFC